MKSLTIILLSTLSLLILFVMVDCAAGHGKQVTGHVTDHLYKPAHQDIQVSTDSDGHVQITTIDYPEEFHLICEASDRSIDVRTTEILYRITNGAPVMIKSRRGKWTDSDYMATVEQLRLEGYE